MFKCNASFFLIYFFSLFVNSGQLNNVILDSVDWGSTRHKERATYSIRVRGNTK